MRYLQYYIYLFFFIIGTSLGWYGHKPAPCVSAIPYASGTSSVVTHVIPGKPGSCPEVTVSAGTSIISKPQEVTNAAAVRSKYNLGVSFVPRLDGSPKDFHASVGMRILQSPIFATVGTDFGASGIRPSLGLTLEF